MTEDPERWAEALLIEKLHGENAARWVAERTVALALAGDDKGVARFREIAARLEALMTRPEPS